MFHAGIRYLTLWCLAWDQVWSSPTPDIFALRFTPSTGGISDWKLQLNSTSSGLFDASGDGAHLVLKRAQPLSYCDAVQKGQLMIQALGNSRTPQSNYPGFQGTTSGQLSSYLSTFGTAMAAAGWTFDQEGQVGNAGLLAAPFAALGVPAGASQYAYKATVENDKAVNGIPATDGFYTQIYNAAYGYIVAENLVSPSSKVSSSSLVPPLNRWSDLTFLVWQYYALALGQNPNALSGVFHYDVQNPDTINIMKAVSNNQVPAWPGITFTMNTNQGMALLGTPNGQGLGWLVAQHKSTFGTKQVASVTIWRATGGYYMMLFQLR